MNSLRFRNPNTKAKKAVNTVIKLRIPGWCREVNVSVNGRPVPYDREKGYIGVNGKWKKGDIITYSMEMGTRIVEANPLVEENRGQVAVQRGPIVYCAESPDLGDIDIDDIAIPVDAKFTPVEVVIDGSRMMALEGEVVVRDEATWKGQLYREVSRKNERRTIRLIPYYAWGNRGKSEMTVWMPAVY